MAILTTKGAYVWTVKLKHTFFDRPIKVLFVLLFIWIFSFCNVGNNFQPAKLMFWKICTIRWMGINNNHMPWQNNKLFFYISVHTRAAFRLVTNKYLEAFLRKILKCKLYMLASANSTIWLSPPIMCKC